jgi:hypothetical protein
MKKCKKIPIFLFAVLLVSCPFNNPNPEYNEKENTGTVSFSVLDQYDWLALQHLEESHEVPPEALQEKIEPFLTNDAIIDPVSVQIITAVIDNGFSSGTANSRAATSAEEASEIPFYVYSITNPTAETGGYAFACGDSRLPGVLAIVENGEFNADNPFTDIFYSNLFGYISETITVYNSITDEDIAAVQEKVSRNIGRAINTTTNGVTTIKGHETPLTDKTKWGQKTPYWDVVNSIRGRLSLSAPSDKKAPTGSAAVAMAQIMAYHSLQLALSNPSNPAQFGVPAWPYEKLGGKTTFTDPYTGETKTFILMYYNNWFDISNNPYANYTSPNANLYKMQIGLLMYEIGVHSKTSYSILGSTANTSNVAAGITNMGYYEPSVFNYDLDKIKSSIEAKKPVYVSGNALRVPSGPSSLIWYTILKLSPNYSGQRGHAWVIDNYMTQTASLRQLEYVHCNLGLNGDNNGWYFSGVFNTTALPEQPSRSVSGTPGYYQYEINIIPDITPGTSPKP